MPLWRCFSCFYFPTEENITELDYSNGTLTNVPPHVSQFGRTLEELHLSSNRITDLSPELFYCQELRVLKVNDNELEAIPSAIGSLRQLQVLDLSRNVLTRLPENIKSCKNLSHLDLSLNNLQRLPEAITNLITLQELLLNETFLEFLPANFGRLVNLKILELRSNNLVTLPKSMARLTELIRIDIGANDFTELPEVIGQLANLRELWIDYNRIRHIPSSISNLRELVHFEATNNRLTNFSNEISSWRNLEVLSLSMNDLEALPFSIGMLKRLITLKCDSNQLKELPDSICHLEELEELVINHNFIVKLPNTIGLLRKMKFLTADENLLRKLPNEISSCTNLSVISFRANKLTELPHDIGHLKKLKVINIVDNLIRSLPVSVLNLTNLSAFWISDNQSQPLVPLQYADNSTKTELTCFMLPQCGVIRSTDTSSHQHISKNKDGWYQELQINNTSPAKRICFADETNDKQSDVITTRLLRSPTPYPKELRQMAKFATRSIPQINSHNVQSTIQNDDPDTQVPNSHSPKNSNQLTSSSSAIASLAINHHIKEAKVLHNSQFAIPAQPMNTHLQHTSQNTYAPLSTISSSSLIIPNCDNLKNVQYYSIGVSPSIQNGEKNEQIYANRSILASIDSSCDGSKHQGRTFDKYESFDVLSTESDDYLDSKLLKDENEEDKNSNNLPHQWNSSPTRSKHQDLYPEYYHPQKSYRQDLHSSGDHHPTQYQRHIIQQRPQEPPPYHIAKAYTKKSREDLLTYDSIRNRNNSIEVLNNLNSCENSPNFDSQLLDASVSYDNAFDKINSIEPISVVSNNNFDFVSNGTNTSNSISLQNGNMIDVGEDEVDHYSTQHYLFNLNDDGNGDALNLQYELKAEYPENMKQMFNKSKTSSPWLFGLHRNPTVKQVTIKKDPTLGFEIKEVTNRGIYVSTTTPNTIANELLRIDDKILDVDGVDFSKINHRDAQQILAHSGPILNIMISRT